VQRERRAGSGEVGLERTLLEDRETRTPILDPVWAGQVSPAARQSPGTGDIGQPLYHNHGSHPLSALAGRNNRFACAAGQALDVRCEHRTCADPRTQIGVLVS
jgi:hypothetical protein